jgi:hypothetical protein
VADAARASAPARANGGVTARMIPNEAQPGGIIGARAAALTQRFGTARLTLPEGDAAKLQFASPTCVLDIYLYPLVAGQEPVATHLETRRRDGTRIERDDCIAALERER